MKTKTLTVKQQKLRAETISSQMFKAFANCVQFNMMDLGKVLDAPRSILLAGGSEAEAEEAIKLAIAKYGINV